MLKKKLQLASALAIAYNLSAPGAYAQEDAREKQSSTEITLSLSTKAAYDLRPFGAQSSFIPAAIPLEKSNNRQQVLWGVGMDLGITKELIYGEEKITCALNTNIKKEKGLGLKTAYLDHKNFLVGLQYSNFCDLDALPKGLGNFPCSTVHPNIFQFTWKDQLDNVSYAIAVESVPKVDFYPAEEKEEEKDKKELLPTRNWPAFSTQIKYKEAFGHVRVGGLLRLLDYYKSKENKMDYFPTWGVNLTTALKIIPEQTTLKLAGVYGQGIGSYLLDFTGTKKEPKDVCVGEDFKLTAIGTWGGYVGIEHCWLPKLRSTVAYGLLDTSQEGREDGAYQQGHYASGNVTYHPMEQLTLGIEYLYGLRFTVGNKESQDAHRVQAAVKFKL